MEDWVGRDIGRYHIVERLGDGGMATVYKAFDTRLEREVAVKFIRIDLIAAAYHEQMLKRFEREAKSLARLSHPNILKVHDFGDVNGLPYLVMEYLAGGTLKGKTGPAMPYPEAAALLAPIARALDYAYSEGIIHRDVKPSNILLTKTGMPLLSDFGIAKILNLDEATNLTGTGVGLGTPEYMAPEQWTGKTSPQTDQYALGVVFYELVTGNKPYTADTPAAILLKQATEPLPHPRLFVNDLPDEVEHLIFKALAKQPGERFTSMADFAEALERLASGRKTRPAAAVVLPAAAAAPAVQETQQVKGAPPSVKETAGFETPPAPPTRLQMEAAPAAPGRKKGFPLWAAIGLLIAIAAGVGYIASSAPAASTPTPYGRVTPDRPFTAAALVPTRTPTPASPATATPAPTLTPAPTQTPAPTRTLPPPPTATPPPTPTPSGPVIQAGNVDKIVSLRTINAHKGAVNTLAFSPGGSLLITGGVDNLANIWQVSDGKLLQTLKGHTGAVKSVAFSRDGKLAATGGDDKTVKLWNVSDGKNIWSINHAAGVVYVGFLPDNQTLASAALGGDARLVNILNNAETRKIKMEYQVLGWSTGKVALENKTPETISLSADGSLWLTDNRTISLNGGNVKVFGGNGCYSTRSGCSLPEIAISSDHKTLAYNNDVFGRQPDDSTWIEFRVGTAPHTFTMEIWDVQSEKLVKKIPSAEGGGHLVFSPNSDLLLSVITTKIQIWDVNGGKLARDLRAPAWLMNLAYSPDGVLIASGDLSGQVILWGIKK